MHAPATTPSSLFADLRALPRTFWILFAGTFINRFGTFVWPFLTIYLTRTGHSLAEASVAVSAFGVGALCGSVLGGWLADHIGRRNTIVLGTFGAATFFMLLYAAASLPAIVACTMLAGLANGTYHPASSALLTDLIPDALRVRAFAAIRAAANAGFACGAAVGGVLANYSLFWLFAGDALTTVLFGIIAFLWLPHGLRGQTHHAPWSDALRQIRGDRTFRAIWLAAFAIAIIFAQFASTYSLHILRSGFHVEKLGLRLSTEVIYGLLIGWNGVLVMLAELPMTSATLRFDARRVMALGCATIGFGFALNSIASSAFTAWIAMTVFTIGEMLHAPTMSAFMARLAPERMRGRYMGALGLAWNSAGIVGPLIGFRLFAIDPRLMWVFSALLGVTAAAIVLRSGHPARCNG
jgi:MFS family permease